MATAEKEIREMLNALYVHERVERGRAEAPVREVIDQNEGEMPREARFAIPQSCSHAATRS